MKIQSIGVEETPLRCRFCIAGASCVVSTNSPAVIDALSQWRCSRDAASARTFHLCVSVDPFAPRSYDSSPHFRGCEHLVVATFGERALFVFDLNRRSVVGRVSKDTAEDGRFWTSLLIPIALGVLGTAVGLVPLHAACLDWNGNGLMIAGASGAGKSTLAVVLSQRGFSLLSDDWTYVAEEAGKITVYGLSTPVKLLADAPRLFPQLRRLQPAKSLNGEMAFEVDAGRTFGSAVRLESEPKWLVLLERSERSGCEMTRISGEEIRFFFECSVERLPKPFAHVAAWRSAIISALARRDCWLLRYGGPPAVAAETLQRFCENS